MKQNIRMYDISLNLSKHYKTKDQNDCNTAAAWLQRKELFGRPPLML